jgi:hypothetical protein
MSSFANGAEKRQFGRRQTNLHAWITVPGRPRIPCIVHDLSVGGARLGFEHEPAGLPFQFKLTIEATNFVTACEIRHQRATSVGVQFVAEPAAVAVDRRVVVNAVEEWTGLGRPASERSAR